MSGEAVSTLAWVWLDTAMNLGMALQVVLADETFLAMRTLELSVSKMGLYVRFDVFLTAESLVTFWVKTNPLSIRWVRSLNECCNVVNGDPSVCD